MLLELAILAAILGLICDQVMSRRAKHTSRPYGLPHFIVAMLFGWLILPLALSIWLVLMIDWRKKRG